MTYRETLQTVDTLKALKIVGIDGGKQGAYYKQKLCKYDCQSFGWIFFRRGSVNGGQIKFQDVPPIQYLFYFFTTFHAILCFQKKIQ
jgi:hypothetical protein